MFSDIFTRLSEIQKRKSEPRTVVIGFLKRKSEKPKRFSEIPKRQCEKPKRSSAIPKSFSYFGGAV